MRLRTAGFAVAAGIAALLVVGVAATEVGTAAGIEFSLFVGIPVGLVAGVGTAAIVFLRFEEPEPRRRWPAVALAGFGAAFVVALFVAAGGFGLRNSVALPVAAVVGLLGAGAAVAWDGRG